MERARAIVRIIALFIVAINALLTAKGINPIPFDENMVSEVVCYIIAGVMAVWSWWKNNNITSNAISAQQYLKTLKWQDGKEDPEGDEFIG